MKKHLLFFLLLIFSQLISSQVVEQTDDDIDEIIENLLDIDDADLIEIINDINKYHFVLVSTDFSSKSYFLGRDLGLDQYNITSQIMYQNHLGIFLGISGTYYSKFDPKWDITVLTGGYGIDFGKNKNLRAELGYSRYIFSDPNSNDFENSIDINLDFSTTNNQFGSSINSSYLFGKRTGFQTSISFYGNLKLFNLNSSKQNTINFKPNLAFIFGSENIDTSRIDNLAINLPFINNIVNSFEEFNLRNTQIRLPIVFDLNMFSIEAGFNINLPKALSFENNVDSTSTFFNLGLSYIFDVNK